MIAQLIVKTLVACQSKVPVSSTSTPLAVDKPSQVSPMVGIDDESAEKSVEWPSVLPAAIGVEDLPTLKPSSDALRFYASEVQLSELTHLAQ